MNLSEALNLIHDTRSGGAPVSIYFISWDRKKREKSKLRFVSQAVECGSDHDTRKNGTVSVLPVNGKHPIPVHVALILKVNGKQVV